MVADPDDRHDLPLATLPSKQGLKLNRAKHKPRRPRNLLLHFHQNKD